MRKARSVTVVVNGHQRTFYGDDLTAIRESGWIEIRDKDRMLLASFTESDVQEIAYWYDPLEGMNWEEVAKAAYEAHRAKAMALPGIPKWEELSSDAKETWKALAQTMREAYKQVLTS